MYNCLPVGYQSYSRPFAKFVCIYKKNAYALQRSENNFRSLIYEPELFPVKWLKDLCSAKRLRNCVGLNG
jgi:hypothetical protein